MKQYLDTLEFVLKNGTKKEDRTGTGTISYFGHQMRFDVSKRFPLLTTKKMFFDGIVGELLWFLSGDTNIRPLVLQDINIWNEWPYKKYLEYVKIENVKPGDEKWKNGIEFFAERIKKDPEFAKRHGNLGPVYGKQWRDFNGVDQIRDVVRQIRENPDSRRMIVSAWNPPEIPEMAKAGLPPCHTMFQFYVVDGKLSLHMYQRSADLFLGVPFNIASYALLLKIMAHVTRLKVGEFIHTFGDIHIYLNHVDQVREQLTRRPYELPIVTIDRKAPRSIDRILKEHIQLHSYNSHPGIKAPIAV